MNARSGELLKLLNGDTGWTLTPYSFSHGLSVAIYLVLLKCSNVLNSGQISMEISGEAMGSKKSGGIGAGSRGRFVRADAPNPMSPRRGEERRRSAQIGRAHV